MENSEGGGRFNPLDTIRKTVQKMVGESRMPTEGFISSMVIYGGKVREDPKHRMVLDRRGQVSKINIFGDSILRTYDEHVMKNPMQLLKRHPSWFLKFLMPGAKRYRGSQQEIVQNIQRLGLENYYGPHPWGIEIKRPEIFKNGIPFQDVLRADLIHSDRLNGIDRFQALEEVAKYMKHIHDRFGGIGEGVPYRFIFQTLTGNRVLDPVLFIPDIVYSQSKYNPNRYDPNKQAATIDQKATDYIEFLMSLGFEELRRSNDLDQVSRILDVANTSYGDQMVIGVTESFARRGRITLEHPIFSQHNRAHLGFDPKYVHEIRQKVIESCEKFRTTQAKQL